MIVLLDSQALSRTVLNESAFQVQIPEHFFLPQHVFYGIERPKRPNDTSLAISVKRGAACRGIGVGLAKTKHAYT